MVIHEQVSEDLVIGGSTYLLKGCHRDWNPLSGHIPPKGTLWELTTTIYGLDHDQKVVGAGKTKEEAIRKIIFGIGFYVGVDAANRHV